MSLDETKIHVLEFPTSSTHLGCFASRHGDSVSRQSENDVAVLINIKHFPVN